MFPLQFIFFSLFQRGWGFPPPAELTSNKQHPVPRVYFLQTWRPFPRMYANNFDFQEVFFSQSLESPFNLATDVLLLYGKGSPKAPFQASSLFFLLSLSIISTVGLLLGPPLVVSFTWPQPLPRIHTAYMPLSVLQEFSPLLISVGMLEGSAFLSGEGGAPSDAVLRGAAPKKSHFLLKEPCPRRSYSIVQKPTPIRSRWFQASPSPPRKIFIPARTRFFRNPPFSSLKS